MKKLLALVLALVMTLGLATVGTNAALSDFSDADQVSKEEAMAVMNAVGVFVGSDGKLDPKGSLTRAAAAKLVAYLALGEDIAEALPKTGSKFADVPDGAWYTGYVNYMVNEGYTSGTGANTFSPNATLTGYQFGAFLLAVLGYDRNLEGMVGSGWETKVAVKLEDLGINKNVDKLGSAALTREEAAQYCLNALKADCVKYADKGTVISIGDATINTGAKSAESVTTGDTNAWANAESGLDDDKLQLGEKLYGTDLQLDKTGIDAQGRTANVWTYKEEEVGTYAKTADKTFVVTSDSGSLKTLAGQLKAQNSKYYIPTKGTAVADADFKTADKNLYVNAAPTAGGDYTPKYGDQVEVFVNSSDSNKIDKVIVTRYTLAEITKVDTNVSTADKKDDVTAYVTLKNAQGTLIAVLKDTKIEGFDSASYVKGAYLAAAFNADKTKVVNSYLATKAAEGKVSSYSTYNFTVAGTALKGVQGGTFVSDYNEGDYDGTYAAYTDANGSLLGIVEVEAAHIATDAVYVNYIWNKDSSGDYSEKTNTTYAQVVDMTGKVSTIVIGKTNIDGEIFGYYAKDKDDAYTYSAWASGDKYYAQKNGTIAKTDSSIYSASKVYAQSAAVTLTDKLYVLTEDESNGYVKLALYTKDTDSTYDIAENLTDDTLTTEALTSKTTKLGGYYVNADTQYIFVDSYASGIDVTVKSGSNVSFGSNIADQIVLYKTSGSAKVASYVIIKAEYNEVASEDVLYAASTTSKGTNTNGTVYALYNKDGVSEDLTVKSFSGTAEADKFEKGYYTYTVNDKGAYTLTKVADNTVGDTWKSTNNTVMGARYNAFFVSLYNNLLTLWNENEVSDIATDKVVVVDKHETDNDEYNYGGAYPARETYSGEVNSLDAIEAADDAGFTVKFDAYLTEDGVTTIFVKDVSRSVITASAKQTTGTNLTIRGVQVVTGDCSGGNGTGDIIVNFTGTPSTGNVITVTIENIAGTVNHTSATLTYGGSEWAANQTIALDYGGNVITYTVKVATT